MGNHLLVCLHRTQEWSSCLFPPASPQRERGEQEPRRNKGAVAKPASQVTLTRCTLDKDRDQSEVTLPDPNLVVIYSL